MQKTGFVTMQVVGTAASGAMQTLVVVGWGRKRDRREGKEVALSCLPLQEVREGGGGWVGREGGGSLMPCLFCLPGVSPCSPVPRCHVMPLTQVSPALFCPVILSHPCTVPVL